MASVHFTYALRRFYPDLKTINVKANTVLEVVDQLDESYPGIKDYIVDERGVLREHVNIFVNNQRIKDRVKLADVVEADEEVYIMQALSGG
ncbi:MAG: MoaD/ThiS family protein [Saprospiraceae bacterium]|nr:MoaD/ThiS family protein [Saprospiraceae bacterium]